jgi:hypothetical protein
MGGVGGICAEALAAITFKFITIQGGLQISLQLNLTSPSTMRISQISQIGVVFHNEQERAII